MNIRRVRQIVKKVIIFSLLLSLVSSQIIQLEVKGTQREIICDSGSLDANDMEDTTKTYINENINAHNYTYGFHANVIASYLEPLENGYMRVQRCGTADVLIEYYDENLAYVSGQILSAELPIFGGFYAGEDAYYLVWGQNNEKEYDSTEVIRVVKYDKNWNRIQACSVYGANTYKSIKFGPVSMTECNGYLFVRTNHEMYETGDGFHHQANMTMQIREKDMEMTDIADEVSNPALGYVSHCMNTFILADDTNHILTLDQGDGAPRGSMLGRYAKEPGDYVLAVTTADYNALVTFEYAGEFGRNTTGATLGGFSYSDTSILVAGTSIEQDENYAYNHTQNLYLAVTDRKELEGTSQNQKSTSTTMRWITDFKEDGKDFHHCATVPRLVKWSNELFLLIWSETEYDNPTGKLYYEFIDGKGNQIGEIYEREGEISDCQPVMKGDKAVWYTTDNESLCFYAIDRKGNLTKQKVTYPEYVDVYPKAIEDCVLAITRVGDFPTGEIDTSYGVYFNGEKLKVEQDYEVVGEGGSSVGGNVYTFRKEILGCSPNFYGRKTFTVKPIREKMILTSITTKSKAVTVKWEKESGCLGYLIYRSENGKKKEKVADITNPNTNIWKDTNVKKGNCYSYFIKAYTKTGEKTIYTKYNDDASVLHGKKNVFTVPKITSVERKKNKATITVSKNKNISGYEYQFCYWYNFNKDVTRKISSKNRITVKVPELCDYVRVRVFKKVNGKKVYGSWTYPRYF